MGLLFESSCMDILGIASVVIVLIIIYLKRCFAYWEKRNLPYLKQENPFRRPTSIGFWVKGHYDRLKAQGHKHGGFYNITSPVYLPIHPEYIKNVMQKDFHHFASRGLYYNERDDPLSANLATVAGSKWKKLRTILTPTFTPGKMKMMFETLLQCSHPMELVMAKYCNNKQAVDINDIVSCFSTDVIGSCVFGLECNSFENPNAEFKKYGKKVLHFSKLRLLKLLFMVSNPKLSRMLGMRLTPEDSSNFIMKVVKDTIRYREAHSIERKDVLQLLIAVRNNGDACNDKGKPLSVEEIAAQAFVFFLAGFETSSTAMTFCLFELSRNPDIQQRVREEIYEVLDKYQGQMTYEAMADLKYMRQVIDETMRMYPPIPVITRRCVKNYKVPDTDITIEKGTHVIISPLGLHRDPEYYPDPEKFDPERFSEENKRKGHPYTYLPFGEGPRICIGLRFGIMQIIVLLTILLKNYKFCLNKKTNPPLKIDPLSLAFMVKEEIWLDVEKLN